MVEGEILYGDAWHFADIIKQNPPRTPFLIDFNSPGGNLSAGLDIGAIIRFMGYTTTVLDGQRCASVCGLAWLAGKPRYAQPHAHIGFHAAFDGDTHAITSSGNALVGAYLDELGLSPEAITWLTSANPDQIAALNFNIAKELGIDVISVPSTPIDTVAPVTPNNTTNWQALGNWIRVGSRDNLDDAAHFASDMANQFGHYTGPVRVFESTSTRGCYVIALGPTTRDQRAYRALQNLFSYNAIPPDSKIVSGRHFGVLVWSSVKE
jgi:hypothetical protein